MKSSLTIATSTVAFLLSSSVSADSLYAKNSAVLQVNGKTYKSLIASSNHTSIVEFYAPWCGHCQSLKPAYEKAAQKLKGLAKVAAVNCDQEANKSLCAEMKIQGFPTLKIVKPSKKSNTPVTEEYQGPRSAKGIVDAVIQKIPNHVIRVTDDSLGEWLTSNNETAKVVLFSNKSSTSALLRALAIDFLGTINFGQILNKEVNAVGTFGVSKYPTLILLPGGDSASMVYDGEMKKEAILSYLSQVSPPNPDPAPVEKEKTQSKKKKTKITNPAGEDGPKKSGSGKANKSKDKNKPLIPPIITEEELKKTCFQYNSKICGLVLLPAFDPKTDKVPESMITGLQNVAAVYEKHVKRRTPLSFYLVEPKIPMTTALRKELNLKPTNELDLVVVNAKKRFIRKFTLTDFTYNNVDNWVDGVRMNEGTKDELPDHFVVPEPTYSESSKDDESEVKQENSHDEL